MNLQERILLVVSVLLTVFLLGANLLAERNHTRLDATIAEMRVDLGIAHDVVKLGSIERRLVEIQQEHFDDQTKDERRDAWMVAHQGELMKRIEKRTEK